MFIWELYSGSKMEINRLTKQDKSLLFIQV